MNYSEDLVKATMRTSIVATELQHTEIQLRLVSVLLAGMMVFNFIDPAIFILNVPTSVMARVASLTGNPDLVGWTFVTMGVLIVPFVMMSVFAPTHRYRREFIRIACLSLALAGALWFLMAWAAKATDFPFVVGVYIRSGLGALGFSLTLALSLNNELARTLLDK